MRHSILALFFTLSLLSCKDNTPEKTTVTQTTENMSDTKAPVSSFKLTPISHATMVLEMNGVVIYVDPVGGVEAFNGMPAADLILVTDIHGDHFNQETLASVSNTNATIVMPQACADKLTADFTSEVAVLSNGEIKIFKGVSIEGIPMYNLREEDKDKHVKGRGNGYVLQQAGKRIYISGDTEDIPEMRSLQNIDVAFVCMNLPYTMTVAAAADAVLAFKPKTVYPYHFRGANGYSDVAKFKSLVNTSNSDITVTQLDWYAQ